MRLSSQYEPNNCLSGSDCTTYKLLNTIYFNINQLYWYSTSTNVWRKWSFCMKMPQLQSWPPECIKSTNHHNIFIVRDSYTWSCSDDQVNSNNCGNEKETKMEKMVIDVCLGGVFYWPPYRDFGQQRMSIGYYSPQPHIKQHLNALKVIET